MSKNNPNRMRLQKTLDLSDKGRWEAEITFVTKPHALPAFGLRPRSCKSRAYITPKCESVLGNIENRFKRPVVLYREILTQVLKEMSHVGIEASWSQRAGCSCGCSPGFVLNAHWDFDIHVSVTPILWSKCDRDPHKRPFCFQFAEACDQKCA